jgi:hypothetical protein
MYTHTSIYVVRVLSNEIQYIIKGKVYSVMGHSVNVNIYGLFHVFLN